MTLEHYKGTVTFLNLKTDPAKFILRNCRVSTEIGRMIISFSLVDTPYFYETKIESVNDVIIASYICKENGALILEQTLSQLYIDRTSNKLNVKAKWPENGEIYDMLLEATEKTEQELTDGQCNNDSKKCEPDTEIQ
jgi:hypothetical protein